MDMLELLGSLAKINQQLTSMTIQQSMNIVELANRVTAQNGLIDSLKTQIDDLQAKVVELQNTPTTTIPPDLADTINKILAELNTPMSVPEVLP